MFESITANMFYQPTFYRGLSDNTLNERMSRYDLLLLEDANRGKVIRNAQPLALNSWRAFFYFIE